MHSKNAAQADKQESQPVEKTQRTKLRSFLRNHRGDFLRGGAFTGGSVAIGYFDSTHPMSYLGNYFNETASVMSRVIPAGLDTQLGLTSGNSWYQLTLISMSFALAAASLYKPTWSSLRNWINSPLGISSAVVADFISEWATKPFGQSPLPVPQGDFNWRIHAAEHSAIFSPLAQYVNNQQNSIIPGAIQGWNIGIEIVGVWAASQFALAYKHEIAQSGRNMMNKAKYWTTYGLLTGYAFLEYFAKL